MIWLLGCLHVGYNPESLRNLLIDNITLLNKMRVKGESLSEYAEEEGSVLFPLECLGCKSWITKFVPETFLSVNTKVVLKDKVLSVESSSSLPQN